MSRPTIVDHAEIIRLYVEQLMPISDVAETVGCSRSVVHRVLANNRVPRRTRGYRPPLQPATPEAVEAYLGGADQDTIAAMLRCGRGTAIARLLVAGVSVRDRHQRMAASHIPAPPDAVELYRSGATIKQVGQLLDCGDAMARSRLVAAGVTIRKGRGAPPTVRPDQPGGLAPEVLQRLRAAVNHYPGKIYQDG